MGMAMAMGSKSRNRNPELDLVRLKPSLSPLMLRKIPTLRRMRMRMHRLLMGIRGKERELGMIS